MADDYLWDGTGPVDTEVAALESVLGTLRRQDPGPFVWATRGTTRDLPIALRPSATIGHARGSNRLRTAVLAAGATAAIIAAWIVGSRMHERDRQTDVHEVASRESVSHVAAPVAAPEQAPPADPRRVVIPVQRDGDSTPSKSKRPAPESSLPNLLSVSQVKHAIAPHLAAARACGTTHQVPAGEKIRVKLSIEGATGRVNSSSATAQHQDTPVGKCVAQALSKAKFRRFAKERMGVMYPITLRGEP